MAEKIVLTPDAGENRLVSDLHGNLAGILGIATKDKANSRLTDSEISAQKAVIKGFKTNKSIREDALQVKLVAGGCSNLDLRFLSTHYPLVKKLILAPRSGLLRTAA